MTEDRINRINGLFDKLLDRVEHEVESEQHELSEEMVDAVIQLQEYKEHVSEQAEQAKTAQTVMAAITRSFGRKGKNDKQ
jgi:hypothetical protein